MKEMIKSMVQEMVMQSIQEVMAEMLGGSSTSNSTQVATAEAVDAPKAPKSTNSKMSREEWMAQHKLSKAEEKAPKVYDLSELDFAAIEGSNKLATFNMDYVPSDVWTANYLTVKRYNGGWSSKNKCFKFNKGEDCWRFFAHAQIIKELTVKDYDNIIAYKEEGLKDMGTYDRQKAEKLIAEWKDKREALKKNKNK